MAGILGKFKVHGSYDKKKDAVRKEREVRGFILRRRIRGKIRYVVLTDRFM
jgi:hypothetical protein